MTKFLTSLCVALALLAGASFAEPANKICPVTSKAGDPSITADYTKKVSFCCTECKAKFDKAPDSFAKEIASYKAGSMKCVLDGKAADGTQTSEFKREITTCCNRCKAKVESEGDKYIVKAVKK